jgi:hypothetical protein
MKIFSRSSKLILSAIAALLVAGLCAGGALGVTSPDQTREGYVAKVEPICKTNVKTSERLLGGVQKMVKEGKLKAAAGKVAGATAAGNKAVAQLKKVPQPTADAAKLGKWLTYLDKEQKFLTELTAALKAEDKTRVQRLTIELTHNGNLANNAVLGFEFKYCLIPTNQFS